MSSAAVLETRSLSKAYGPVRALVDLDLALARGEVLGFLGPNGAGKTTTIRMLLGLLKPSGGVANILGLDTWHQSVAVRRHVGYLPGDVRLWDSLRGGDVLKRLARLRAASGEMTLREIEGRANLLTERLDLDLTKRVRAYSKGNRQKIGIVQALMHAPQLLILDEPTSALDPLIQETVYELLREARDDGASIFFSSHVLSEVEKVCDRVAILRGGRLLDVVGVEELVAMKTRRVRLRFAPDDASGDVRGGGASALQQAGYDLRPASPRNGNGTYEFSLRGDVNALLSCLADHRLESLDIEPMSLEEVFLEYYRTPGADETAREGAS